MNKPRCIACALAVAMPLALVGSQAFAFSYGEGPPGYSNGNTFADPDSQFDAMSEHMSQMYDAQTPDYSEMLTNHDSAAPTIAAQPAPRIPGNIGSQC